jgi:hypothetical protein
MLRRRRISQISPPPIVEPSPVFCNADTEFEFAYFTPAVCLGNADDAAYFEMRLRPGCPSRFLSDFFAGFRIPVMTI